MLWSFRLLRAGKLIGKLEALGAVKQRPIVEIPQSDRLPLCGSLKVISITTRPTLARQLAEPLSYAPVVVPELAFSQQPFDPRGKPAQQLVTF